MNITQKINTFLETANAGDEIRVGYIKMRMVDRSKLLVITPFAVRVWRLGRPDPSFRDEYIFNLIQ